MDKKFELTDETIMVEERTLHRIRALIDIKGTFVRKGDLGGFLEKEENLSHEGNCWIYNNACVYADARVSGNAHIYGDALIYDNTHVSGNTWVFGNARVSGKAHVYGNAWVSGNVTISDKYELSNNAYVKSADDICYISSFGSKNRHTTFFRCKDNTIKVKCGCFSGTLDEFRDKVKETYGDNKYAKEYLLAIDLAELKFSHEKKDEVE